jgi:hypothetical protein
MTDVLAPVLIPYARFLEVRARRLDIVTELTQPIGQRADNVTASSAPIANNERARVAVSVLAADPAAGVRPNPHDSREEKEKPRQQSIVGD